MNPFQEKIAAWLSRTGPERSLNQCFDLPIVLGTDIGLQRSENQDRVAALRIPKTSGGRPLIAVAVVDGMGGMRDGGKCATLALSSFFYALTLYRGHDLQRRATAAISHANDEVFKFAGGKGGATLSAVLVDHDLRPFIVNLGDSRIYAFGRGMKVERLTRDDSLAEAVGGHGRELLQFVGMGEGMQPHVRSIPAGIQNLAITTDGIHFVESATLEAVLSHAVELKSASERLAALARWCGAPDNASSAVLDLQSLFEEIRRGDDHGIQLWDPFGSLAAIWIKDESANGDDKSVSTPALEKPIVAQLENPEPYDPKPERSKDKPPSKKEKKAKKSSPPKENIQLEIQIERSSSPDEPDENSR
jgi:serine/threonine protein phosphatase PrpC